MAAVTESIATGLRRPRLAGARRAELAVTAALLSAGAAAIHASVAGPHFQEYVPYGALFVLSALAQAAWAALVLVAPSARLLAVGAMANGGIIATWALSRTTGLPFGPEPWTPEPVAALDIGATVFELGIVAASLLLLAANGPNSAAPVRSIKRFAAVGAAAIAALTGAAFAGTVNGPAGHHGNGAGQGVSPGHHQNGPDSAGGSVRGQSGTGDATRSGAARPPRPGQRSTRNAGTRARPHDATPHAHAAPNVGG